MTNTPTVTTLGKALQIAHEEVPLRLARVADTEYRLLNWLTLHSPGPVWAGFGTKGFRSDAEWVVVIGESQWRAKDLVPALAAAVVALTERGDVRKASRPLWGP